MDDADDLGLGEAHEIPPDSRAEGVGRGAFSAISVAVIVAAVVAIGVLLVIGLVAVLPLLLYRGL